MAAVPARSPASPYELRYDSGRVCLDLVATAHPHERLTSPDLLRAWLVGAGLVPRATAPPVCAPSWLAAFRVLRGHVSRSVRGEL
ncbi:ABATE domain-containing protein, partial [Streptomyces beihaiensis]